MKEFQNLAQIIDEDTETMTPNLKSMLFTLFVVSVCTYLLVF